MTDAAMIVRVADTVAMVAVAWSLVMVAVALTGWIVSEIRAALVRGRGKR